MTERSAVERVSEALERAHRWQPALNAFTSIDDEGALARAAAIDRLIENGENPGPLAGVPIGLKDLIDHEGHVTTAGSAFYRKQADQSAPCVRGLESAGAVIIGRTGLHEWAFGFSSENPHWGPVRNPWDTESSTGGSSGGSAAAVAAGIVPIAIGTDTGGSVRVPSALCGTFGLKVTYGRIPLDGVFPLVASIDTVGPLGDSIESLELSYRAMSSDRTPLPQPRRLRIGIPQPWVGSGPTDSTIASAFESTIDALRALGHEVGGIDMDDVIPAPPMWHAIAPEAREVHADFRSRGEVYGDDISQRLDDAEKVTDADIGESRRWQQRIRVGFGDALETVDVLITPTVPVAKKRIGVDEIAGRHYRAVLSYFSALVNHSLHPALAVPISGTGKPPASLQVIGKRNAEADLLSFGRHLEEGGLAKFDIPSPKFT